MDATQQQRITKNAFRAIIRKVAKKHGLKVALVDTSYEFSASLECNARAVDIFVIDDGVFDSTVRFQRQFEERRGRATKFDGLNALEFGCALDAFVEKSTKWLNK